MPMGVYQAGGMESRAVGDGGGDECGDVNDSEHERVRDDQGTPGELDGGG